MKYIIIIIIALITMRPFDKVLESYFIARNKNIIMSKRLLIYTLIFLFFLLFILIVGIFLIERDMKYTNLIKTIGLLYGIGLVCSTFLEVLSKRPELEKKLQLYLFYFMMVYSIVLFLLFPVVAVGMKYIIAMKISGTLIGLGIVFKRYLIELGEEPQMEMEIILYLIFSLILFLYGLTNNYFLYKKVNPLKIIILIYIFYIGLGLACECFFYIRLMLSIKTRMKICNSLLFLIVLRIIIFLVFGY